MSPRTNRSANAVRDGARQHGQDPTRYRAVVPLVKSCLECGHWARFHPGRGPCTNFVQEAGHRATCYCTKFVDPLPGRPDRIFTRDQVDRMRLDRWNLVKDRIFLLRDGTYGVWDDQSDPAWLAKPGEVVLEQPE